VKIVFLFSIGQVKPKNDLLSFGSYLFCETPSRCFISSPHDSTICTRLFLASMEPLHPNREGVADEVGQGHGSTGQGINATTNGIVATGVDVLDPLADNPELRVSHSKIGHVHVLVDQSRASGGARGFC
jgi:hypothetical protein